MCDRCKKDDHDCYEESLGDHENDQETEIDEVIATICSTLEVVERIEAISTKLPAKIDQSVRNIVRLISEKGEDYADTEYGDMTLRLLCDLEGIMLLIPTTIVADK